ncbi:FecR domain-containing protein [Acidovorax sp. SUPP3334]|uniref:FecR family protein n=1 Tax=Acidovorax sp. SUPP3334 TaxID=2920881 RepID=UPI0023DE21C1|nr:FecR domain-containing protein [Acidovorax sp. SUPP3334]GKT25649.1 FecR domain-containing protein [Acidovorax sp. SUPP3334]
MSVASAPRERLIEQAIALIVQADVAPDPTAQDARAALAQWRLRSGEHEAAAQEARQRWDAIGGVSSDLRAHFGEAAAAIAPGAPRRSRRHLFLSAATLVGTGLLAGRGMQWYWRQPVFTASYATRTAQVLKVSLTDGMDGGRGTRLDLSPQSALDVALYRQRRSVHMARGEVRFEVAHEAHEAHDAGRPFVVHARGARIEVIGTIFTVRDRGGAITVGVERGQVRVQPLPAEGLAGDAIDLRPGQLLEIREGQAAPVRAVDPATLSPWRDGWLVFQNEPLRDALATVNAYRAQPITLGDEKVGGLRLSSRFRAGDSAALLATLPAILPLTVHRQADGSAELRAR